MVYILDLKFKFCGFKSRSGYQAELAQRYERLPYKQRVSGSIPLLGTIFSAISSVNRA